MAIYKLKVTNEFEDDMKWAKGIKLDLGELETVIDTLLSGKNLEKRYKPHKLHGNYKNIKGCWECHVNNDYLLIYKRDKKLLTLVAIRFGPHARIF